jgi:hypothetical protein
MEGGIVGLDLAAQRDLALRDLHWTSGAWSIVTPEGGLVSAAGLQMRMTHTGGMTYKIDLSADAPAPGDVLRDALRVPKDWPVEFEALAVDASVAFDRAWDMRAVNDRRPQPRRLDLRLARATWGSLHVNIAANLDIDADGLSSGDIHVQAENWRDMLQLAETAGILPTRLLPQADRALSALAGASGNPSTIDVTLTARRGLLTLGFIPLGPAPRIVLR